ncbi:protein POLLENLESS 3 [Malania oleifera]|uniref:protein POLLENLESS 3 n=1 Tax=Malania oleifera TaxID=397392 RepID=UPI0025AE25DB|nr:protein POLLENLESS 3 [Malania oleifera]
MWSNSKGFPATGGFLTPPPNKWKSKATLMYSPASEKKPKADLFHVIHKVPAGDSPYVKAKQVQLIEKDPSRAISLFWAAINSGDRVDSALKDMAVVMKQLNRSDEAIEAIKSFRHLCPLEAQESLDNVLVELYKRSGRLGEQIELLEYKLKRIEEGIAFGGKRTKTARSQGKKIQITIEQEKSRLLGNLAWAYLQQNSYITAERLYRKALSLEPDKNKECNLAICWMHLNRIAEAKSLLQSIKASSGDGLMDESYAKSFERASQILTELLESKSIHKPIEQEDYDNCKELQKYNIRGSPFGNHIQNEDCFYGFGRGSQFQQNFFTDSCKGNFYSENPSESSMFSENPYARSSAASPIPIVGNPKPPFSEPRRGSWMFNNREEQGNELHKSTAETHKSKKSWADMVEEDEQELYQESSAFSFGLQSKCSDGWDSGQEFRNENLNYNIFRQTPPLDQADKLKQKLEPTARRSLCFNKDMQCSSPPPQKALNFEGFNYVSGSESETTSGNSIRLKRRNRLQVFQDITPESPRA